MNSTNNRKAGRPVTTGSKITTKMKLPCLTCGKLIAAKFTICAACNADMGNGKRST